MTRACLFLCPLSVVALASSAFGAEELEFNRDIRPILAESCLLCHGFDKNSRQGDLRLDVLEDAVRDHNGVTPIVPGKPEASEVIRRITSDDPDEGMPPPETGKRLTADQIETLRRWIADGAKYQPHWSYLPPKETAVPAVRSSSWPRNEIDRFVLARLNDAGLSPAVEASRETLIRRVTLDLTGLPPTLAELDAFLADRSADAYEKLVDRLLASPAYGEHMAQAWLDLARYSDTDGFDHDETRHIWPYRDWVIKALNDDLPFDQFTLEQLAGDLLPEASDATLTATGFLRNSVMNREQGIDITQWWYATLVDRVNTVGTTWLGSTIACAQCHDHKYDPYSQQDYYRLLAIFNNDAYELEPETIGGDPSHRKDISPKHEVASVLQPEARAPTLIMRRANQPRETCIHLRGNFKTLGEPVEPGMPAFLGNQRFNDGPVDRLALARWLIDDDHPLTARVAVNRIWHQHFGRGLVETLDDLGSRGAPPSHPELLDWLAVRFRQSGWKQKAMHRLIVTSATYRQSSARSADQLRIDPRNRWLSSFPRQRLSAEALRDNALAIGGVLTSKLGGPPVFPFQPADAKSSLRSESWPTSEAADRHRRGIYTFWRRTSLYASFMTFDAPTRETCSAQRIPTNTPLQALDLLNDLVFLHAARGLATRLLEDAGPSTDARLHEGMRRCVARAPTDEELRALRSLYEQLQASFAADTPAATALIGTDQSSGSAATTPAELAAWILVANTLLNLDETVTRP